MTPCLRCDGAGVAEDAASELHVCAQCGGDGFGRPLVARGALVERLLAAASGDDELPGHVVELLGEAAKALEPDPDVPW